MSEAFRGFVLLLSVVLWLPCLMPLLSGEMSTSEAGIRYGAALLFAWGGCAAVGALLKAYAPQPAEDPDPADDLAVEADRRASASASGSGPAAAPVVESAKAEVLVERRSRPRDDDAVAT